MALGLIATIRGAEKKTPRWLDVLAIACIVSGFIASFYDLGGIFSYGQILEILLTAGFLAGTYLIAKNKPQGYLCFMLMNISCALLMAPKYPWLSVQQCVSLGFVIYAYIIASKQPKQVLKKFVNIFTRRKS